MGGFQKIIYPELSYKIVGIFFSVHNELGRYRNEKQYSDAIEEKFKQAGIKFEREKTLEISFIGERKRRNIIDFLVDETIILEIKCKKSIFNQDYIQLRRYLVSADKKL